MLYQPWPALRCLGWQSVVIVAVASSATALESSLIIAVAELQPRLIRSSFDCCYLATAVIPVAVDKHCSSPLPYPRSHEPIVVEGQIDHLFVKKEKLVSAADTRKSF